MFRKKNLFLLALILLGVSAFFLVFKNRLTFLEDDKQYNLSSKSPAVSQNMLSEDKIKQPNIFSKNPSSDCTQMAVLYGNFEKVKKTIPMEPRFENVHKQIGESVYRFRRFFKDGDENEVETFLLYLEEDSENTRIIEKNSYKKGPRYAHLESSEGDILYREVGVNVDSDLFLHYINGQLATATAPALNCHYQQD